MKKLILFALVAMTMTSCVSKKQYQEAVDAKNALQTKYDDLQGQYNSQALSLRECETNNKNYDRMLNAAQNEMKDLKTANAALQESLSSSVSTSGANISKLVDEINASNKYIQQLVEAKSKSDSLSIALTNKLNLEGMKENVICGHLIPAGTGLREFEKIIVGSKEEYERMQANRKNVLDFAEEAVIDEQ